MPRCVASHLDPTCFQRPSKFGSSTERVNTVLCEVRMRHMMFCNDDTVITLWRIDDISSLVILKPTVHGNISYASAMSLLICTCNKRKYNLHPLWHLNKSGLNQAHAWLHDPPTGTTVVRWFGLSTKFLKKQNIKCQQSIKFVNKPCGRPLDIWFSPTLSKTY